MTVCSHDGCDNPAHARGMCPHHYSREMRRGSDAEPLRNQPPLRMSLEDRFWYSAEPGPGCWNWTGPMSHGYGQFHLAGRKHYAHRVSYLLNVGDIPDGLHLDHVCRNKACVNPEHLEPVTFQENLQRWRATL